MDEYEARRALVETCTRLYDRNLTVSAGGNMSVRVDDGILITPSGRNKGLLKPDDLVKVALDGTVISGGARREGRKYFRFAGGHGGF